MKSYRRIRSLQKAIEILQYLAEQSNPVSAYNIADFVGLPYGTLMTHLVTFEDAGFVRKVGEKWELGFSVALIRAKIKKNLEVERDEINRKIGQFEGVEIAQEGT
ncbi:MAG: helix-turn-helix domain-containing protein [Deltaproteobacteria bacterium]|nr:helix-turn-helix domain-containing protein [Deltaproteobacteria bacterium]